MRIFMKIKHRLLAAAVILSILTVHSGFQAGEAAQAASKKITIKAAADFKLKIPADWKKNYILKRSRDKKQGSYVAFYAKKCYRQKKCGWLFSIMRYKDESYGDLPSYELVGKWNGFNYVALFPTDVQTEGVTQAARKQYMKLNKSSARTAASIFPVKKGRTGKLIFRTADYTLKLPADWKNNYTVEKIGNKKKKSYKTVNFYSKKCHAQIPAGWLFTIAKYKGNSYQQLPSYELIGKWNGYHYVAIYPTDVQFEGATKSARKQYQKLSRTAEKAARSIRPFS